MGKLLLGQMFVASLLIAAVPAIAQDAPVAQLDARGVDLSDAAVRASFERRIDQAAAKVCGVDPKSDVAARRQQNMCLIAAGNEGRAQMKRIMAAREVRMAGL